MNTIILFGSARSDGYTRRLADAFCSRARGPVYWADVYRMGEFSGCIDCRHCWKERNCCLDDAMQPVYPLLENADVVVIAAPIYFYSLPGELKKLIDRLQPYFCAIAFRKEPPLSPKKAALILTGGARYFEKQFSSAETVTDRVFHDLNAHCEGVIRLPNTDHVTQPEFEEIIRQTKELADRIYF